MRRLIGFTAVLAITAAGLAAGREKGGNPVAAKDTNGAAVAAGNTRFALDLYAKLRGGDGNLFFSPWSISTALSLTSAGAKGETDREMAAALHLPADQAARHDGFRALIAEINGKGLPTPRPDTLVTANALWLQKGEPLLPSFLDLTHNAYDAEAREVDFAHEPEPARKTINAWVEEKTRDKIRNLLQPSDVTRDTNLVLTNAVYFKGAWRSPFTESATKKDGTFTTQAGTKVTVPLMTQTESYRYLDGGSFQALELPYMGDGRSMVVLLPKKVDGLAALETSLTQDALDGWLGKLARQRVRVELPKFRLEETFSLAEVLKALGMSAAFDPSKADFSGIAGTRDRVISAVIHKAFVDVDEKGTEAAAATAVVMVRAMAVIPAEPVLFRADHPFLFLIRDQKTGSVLFLGRVVNPKA
jgi:serpin B